MNIVSGNKINLYQCFAEKWCRGGNIWIYSDPHFGDSKAVRFRDYKADDAIQIRNINSKVGKKDTIIFLGDIGNPECISKIRGYKVLIKGNHDVGTSNYQYLFNEIYDGPLTINNKIILSHEPINLPFIFNIHGHKHDLPHKYDDHHLNVCAEAINYTPISLLSLIKNGAAAHVDDIHRVVIDAATKRKGAY